MILLQKNARERTISLAFCSLYSGPLCPSQQKGRDQQDDRLIDPKGIPYNAASENRREQQNDDGIYRKASQDIDHDGGLKAGRGIQISRDHHIQRCNDKFLMSFPLKC